MSDFDFGRVYKLTITRAPEFDAIKSGSAGYFDDLSTVFELTDHDISFKIEKHLLRIPNQGEVTIYNLSEGSRNSLVGGPARVHLEAGYDDNPRLLFLGDVRYASNELTGTEWMTKLQLGDGSRAYSEVRHNKNYAAGTPMSVIVADLVRAFGTALPAEVNALQELSTRIPASEAVTGYAADELQRILEQIGLEWSIQGGRVQILRVDDVVPGLARIIAAPPDGGMIGSPVIDPPKIRAPRHTSHRGKGREPKVPKLKVKHTLYPELTPGELLELRTRSINDTFRLDAVVHEGHTRGPEWTSHLEGRAI